MNLTQFKTRANKKPYNTNNAWGFGGAFGTSYELGDMRMDDLKLCFRHTGTTPIKKYYIATKQVTKVEFENTLNSLV
jgi:hypothetical protein